MIQVISEVPEGIFGVRADGAFDRPDLDGLMLDFDALSRPRRFRKLLIEYTVDALPSTRTLADTYTNWVAMRDIKLAALVAPEMWHEQFETFCCAINADYRIFAPGEREAATAWLLGQPD